MAEETIIRKLEKIRQVLTGATILLCDVRNGDVDIRLTQNRERIEKMMTRLEDLAREI